MVSAAAKYALRLVTYVAWRGAEGFVSSATLAKAEKVPKRFCDNIATRLVRGGVLLPHYGKLGGYKLARPAAEISVADVIRAVDGPVALTRCVADDNGERCAECPQDLRCDLRAIFARARAALLGVYERTTLDQLVAARQPA